MFYCFIVIGNIFGYANEDEEAVSTFLTATRTKHAIFGKVDPSLDEFRRR